MTDASDLLFTTNIDGKPLFKNQLELVNHLLHTPGSAYLIKPDLTKDDENRAQGRLKTYISQLLSNNVFRNITEDFKASLKLVLSSRLPADLREDVLNAVVNALQQKNDALVRKEESLPQLGSKISLKEDIRAANYVAVISARPIDMNLPIKESEFNVRNWFYDDLVKTMFGSVNRIKNYRFNFPTETYCDLFWQGLEKIMIKYLFSLADQIDYIKFQYSENFTITTETLHDYELYLSSRDSLSKDEVIKLRMDIMRRIAVEMIERLNQNKFVSVFFNTHPIFSIPIIAMNPNESNCKVYGLLDSEEDKNVVYKFSQENTTLWRIFFWDKVKASDMGQAVHYKNDLNHSPSY